MKSLIGCAKLPPLTLYSYIKGPELLKRLAFQTRVGGGLFKEIFQVTSSTELCNVKYIFQLDNVSKVKITRTLVTFKLIHVFCMVLIVEQFT